MVDQYKWMCIQKTGGHASSIEADNWSYVLEDTLWGGRGVCPQGWTLTILSRRKDPPFLKTIRNAAHGTIHRNVNWNHTCPACGGGDIKGEKHPRTACSLQDIYCGVEECSVKTLVQNMLTILKINTSNIQLPIIMDHDALEIKKTSAFPYMGLDLDVSIELLSLASHCYNCSPLSTNTSQC